MGAYAEQAREADEERKMRGERGDAAPAATVRSQRTKNEPGLVDLGGAEWRRRWKDAVVAGAAAAPVAPSLRGVAVRGLLRLP